MATYQPSVEILTCHFMDQFDAVNYANQKEMEGYGKVSVDFKNGLYVVTAEKVLGRVTTYVTY